MRFGTFKYSKPITQLGYTHEASGRLWCSLWSYMDGGAKPQASVPNPSLACTFFSNPQRLHLDLSFWVTFLSDRMAGSTDNEAAEAQALHLNGQAVCDTLGQELSRPESTLFHLVLVFLS